MIKLENTEVVGWEAAIRGMRNPLESWEKSDSEFGSMDTDNDQSIEVCNDSIWHDFIGPNDQNLMMKLRKAGTDHRKFMRMITVYVDITAPLYWWPEFDTYKVGTVRNSCSFMHKGVSRPFSIHDFSLKDSRIYECLNSIKPKTYEVTYPYETDEYKLYISPNGRRYKIFRNGKIVSCAFSYTDTWGSGRTRTFPERICTPSGEGYKVVVLGGRSGIKKSVHRLVAETWQIPKPDNATQINHIDGNKGNNSVENLEWVTPQQNVSHGFKTGLFDNVSSLHRSYQSYKSQLNTMSERDRFEFSLDVLNNVSNEELSKKYGLTPKEVSTKKFNIIHNAERIELFNECFLWEKLIDILNSLRELYLETKDSLVFQQIRSLIPQGYMVRSTVCLNYEVLANIYKSRKDHKLDEWHDFCDWITTLPYPSLITGATE